MWDWIVRAFGWLLKKEGAAIAVDAFGRLSERLENRLERAETRLDECDDDRRELRTEVGGLKQKVEDCDEDRKDLRERIESLERNTK